MSRWLPNEVALAGNEHLDGAYVAGCDRKVGATGRPPDLDPLIGLGLGAGSTLVDLGAGTGTLALDDHSGQHADRLLRAERIPGHVRGLHLPQPPRP